MQYTIWDLMEACSEADVARLLPLVSAQRREQALRFSHLFGRWACLKTYEMLLQLLNPEGGMLPEAQRPEFVYSEYGQPLLPNGPYFSISHCRHALAVAVDDAPIGIDIESIRNAGESLVHRVMNAEEVQQIAMAKDADRAFIRLWTQKEALLKQRGTGIIDDMRPLLTEENKGRIQTAETDTYIFSIARV